MKIRMYGVIPESIVDGPGIRYVVATQGCNWNCEGCQNPDSHDVNGGREQDTEKIAAAILKNPMIDGVTFSGGDPMLQIEAVTDIIDRVHSARPDLDFWLYTGFEIEALINMSNTNSKCKELLSKLDVIVDGKFDISKRSLTEMKGSTNQRFVDSKKSIKAGRYIEYIADDYEDFGDWK